MPILTPLDEFRLGLGDHPTPDTPEGDYVYLLNDDECDYFIDKHPTNLMLALADACDALAARFARGFDFAEDGQSFSRSQMASQYAARATEYRRIARRQGAFTAVTLVTPYSGDDADAEV